MKKLNDSHNYVKDVDICGYTINSICHALYEMIDKILFTTQSSFFHSGAISHKNKAFLIILVFFLLIFLVFLYFITKCYALIIPEKPVKQIIFTPTTFARIFHSVLLQVSLLFTFTWLLWSYCLNWNNKKDFGLKNVAEWIDRLDRS